MTFLPIVARELRVASRRRSTFWGRALAALAVIVIGTWTFFMMQQERPQTIALTLFGVMTGSASAYGLFCGLWSTADCLSQEKREGTLGLLFLTDLRGYDVVLGKLAATSLNAFYSALAVMPMLAVPLLLGGVTLGEIGRMALVIVNTLFFSLTLGLCVSAMSRSARKALLATLLLILFFAALLPLIAAWLDSLGGKPQWLIIALLVPGPGFTFATAFDDAQKTLGREFWWSLATIHVLGWAFLLLASLVAPRAWQDKPAGAPGRSWRQRWRLWRYGDPHERRAFRARLLDQNAYSWLASRVRLRPAFVWMALGAVGCVWAWGLAKFHRDWLVPFMYFLTAGFLNLLLKCWAAAEAGRQLAEDRYHGTLELVLSTSLSVRDILRGEWMALQRQFLAPVTVTLMLFVVFLAATLSETTDESERTFWGWLYLAGMLSLVADLVALYWIGMWRGLTARNPLRAVMGTVARILVLPWLGLGLASLIVAIAAAVWQCEPQFVLFVFLWLAFGLAVDLGFGAWARHKLLAEFRLAAAERYTQQAGFWKALFGKR